MLNLEIKGRGTPILCLHGHPGSSQSLTLFTDHLSQNYYTLAPDLRGYGQSPARGKFEIRQHLEDLETLLDAQKIPSCWLLGWSFGGILALELALKNPQRYRGLILIASAARPWGSHPRTSLGEVIFTLVAGLVNYLRPGSWWNIEVFGKRSLLRYLLHQQTPEAYRYLARDGTIAYLRTSIPAHIALNQALAQGYDRSADLKNLEIPCLILGGSEDRHITWASSLETAQKLPNCQWKCYPNTAHLFPWEVPTQVLEDIEEWLAKYE
jgi:proline iminopeptidase